MSSAYSNSIQKETKPGRFLKIGIFIFLMAIAPDAFAQVETPYAGSGTAFMHDDALSSDVFEGKAPSGEVNIEFETKMGAVPTILQGSDGLLQVICVRNESKGRSLNRTPYLLLLDPKNMQTLASLKLPGGKALNNIYGYLNADDQMMLANGQTVFEIGHMESNGDWSLEIENRFTLQTSDEEAQFVAITPDWEGNIWFATQNAKAGFLNLKSAQFSMIDLSDRSDETVANSISSSPAGVAIATTHSVYMLNVSNSEPQIAWSADYDRGNRVKPGQLSWGTGSSPTFFGEKTGYEYLTILDNGTDGTHLNIYDSETGELIASPLTFGGDINQGSEDSPIGYKNSVIIASTYGFPYPASSIATNEVSDFKFGMQRIMVLPDGSGAKSVWFNKEVRSASVPKLGRDQEQIYFIHKDKQGQHYYATVDFETGQLVSKVSINKDPLAALPHTDKLSEAQKRGMLKRIGNPFNPLEMAGLYDGKGNLYQGTKLGILKISSVQE